MSRSFRGAPPEPTEPCPNSDRQVRKNRYHRESGFGFSDDLPRTEHRYGRRVRPYRNRRSPVRTGAAATHPPNQSETFEVAEERLNLEVDGEEWTLGAGESATVPPGQPHRYWNGSDEQVRATMELRPAGNFEMFLETTAGLAAVGKVNAAGVPNLLQTAVILQEYWNVFRLVGPLQ